MLAHFTAVSDKLPMRHGGGGKFINSVDVMPPIPGGTKFLVYFSTTLSLNF